MVKKDNKSKMVRCESEERTFESNNLTDSAKVANYSLHIDLLSASTNSGNIEAERRAKLAAAITRKLALSGIRVKIADIAVGAAITKFTFVVLPQHTRASDFAKFADSIETRLKTLVDVHIEDAHGREKVVVEVVNEANRVVLLRDILESESFQRGDGELLFAVGQNDVGEAIVADLADVSHVLLVGDSDTGKSMALNCMIVSLLYKYSPEQVRFIMVDTKFVGLSRYNGIPHMLMSEAVTTETGVSTAMDDLIDKMKSRYRLFRKKGVKNIREYNRNISYEMCLPYLVFVMDELSNSTVANRRVFKRKLSRILQKSASTGIHIVIAAQRDVDKKIMDIIKAKAPCRMIFETSCCRNDNTTVRLCDVDRLLNKGKMAFISPKTMGALNVRGAYVSYEEIKRIVEYLCATEGAHRE